ncbi:ParB/RepB/Spo0J family partition protein [bacterium]|nr:ParB/RepB/Spo0J family partition protein [bacterium]
MPDERILHLPLDQVRCLRQVREHFDDNGLTGLAMSLKTTGQLVPIRVRREGNDFVVVDGERRFRASVKAGRTSIAAIIEEGDLSQGQILERQLTANCQRADLTPLEKARAIVALMEVSGENASETASRLGMSNSAVTRLVTLLSLPESIKGLVDSGKIPPSTACEIAKINDPAKQMDLARQAVEGRLTRDAAIGVVRKSSTPQKSEKQVGTRAIARLDVERSVTVAAKSLSLDSFIGSLEELLAKARKSRTQGFELTTFIKMLSDQAKGEK